VAKIIYVQPDGARREIEAPTGLTVMEGAVRNGVRGIDADCSGACACATCHVYIDAPWSEVIGKPTPMEASMLDFADHVQPSSRLSCQIKVTDALNGLIVRLPESQHG
jgi:2Fe-2S ferredoxin